MTIEQTISASKLKLLIMSSEKHDEASWQLLGTKVLITLLVMV